MKGDFSRDTFDPSKHLSRVLQQQGRVQLDADANEQTAILLHYLRTLAADLIGPFAGPEESNGFQITNYNLDNKNFDIGAGRYYVDGILCENETNITYLVQKDYPNPPTQQFDNGVFLVYLDVWERHITALEDDYIREKALGGPDTATRTQVVQQVKMEDFGDNFEGEINCGKVRADWENIWVKRWQPPYLGCLKARVEPSAGGDDFCLTAPDAKYRGLENQLYRVEIHQGGIAGQGVVTIKWSRDNGMMVSRVEKLSDTELIAEKPQFFSEGVWVELTNDEQELRGQPGSLVRLLKVERDRLTFEPEMAKPDNVPEGEDWPTKARRWDQQESIECKLVNGAVPLKEKNADDGNWIKLENSIQIQFLPAPGGEHTYRSGDYWLIPARVATGNIEWPVELDEDGEPKLVDGKVVPIPKAPFGVRHHYAPLAILDISESPSPLPSSPTDCRCHIPSLNSCKMPSAGEKGIGGHQECDEESVE